MTTAATIYMSLRGATGLHSVASHSHANSVALLEKLTAIDGVERVFERPFFHETVIRLPKNSADIVNTLNQNNILAGYDLSNDYPELNNSLLVCATETKTEQDLEFFANRLQQAL